MSKIEVKTKGGKLYYEFCKNVGKKLYSLDYLDNKLVITIFMSSFGAEKSFKKYDIEKINKKEITKEMWTKINSLEDNSEGIKKILKENDFVLPNLPLPNYNITCGYNDPTVDLVAYWYLEDIKDSVNFSDIGYNSWYTVKRANWYIRIYDTDEELYLLERLCKEHGIKI